MHLTVNQGVVGQAQHKQPKVIMTEENKNTIVITDTWAGAFREFFKQLGSVATLLIIVLSIGQCSGCFDFYRVLDR